MITKDWIKKQEKIRNCNLFISFISGLNINPNPKLYKYYFWIYSLESKEKNADEIFYKDEYKLSISEFENKYNDLKSREISFVYINVGYKRLNNTVFDYKKIKEKYPETQFAISYEDDTDKMNDKKHK
ncbi:hypothetical protein CRU92_04560 [Arcobacter sp. FW59]|nr:hypothetical protein CRU92_04560 [Arcobacter sp. FW59]